MKNYRKKHAVTEILGTAILLGIAIALFSGIQYVVFSYPFEPSPPSINLVGTVNESNYIIIEHQGGEYISLDAIIIFNNANYIARDYLDENTSNNDDYWNIGERVVIPLQSEPDRIQVFVVDSETNTIIMSGLLKEGSS